MIFKKPYGFLIKHFKLIHLILTGIYIYLTMKVSSMLDFYNKFELGIAGKLDAINYVNNNYLIAVVSSIIICIIVYLLLRYKKKPRILYIILIIFSLVQTLIINTTYKGLEEIYISVLNIKTLRLYRDLLKILVVLQYLSIITVLIRALGFDIKKFNFVKDLQELNPTDNDDEEVEITLGDSNIAQRKFFRKKRELKYYYLENKNFIHLIIIVILVLGLSSCYVNKEVINKVYNQKETFQSGNFSFNVVDSYLTSYDYNNKEITTKETFLILKTQISSNANKKINTGNIVLNIGYNNYPLTTGYTSRFQDLGIIYQSQEIKGTKTYLFLFKIAKEDTAKDIKLIYAGDKSVIIKPINLDEKEETINIKLGNNLEIPNWFYNGGNIKISSIDIKPSFPYSYTYEIGGQTFKNEYQIESIKGAIMNLKITSNYNKTLDDYTFIKQYATLKYKIKENIYEIKNLDNKTPGNYKEGLYLAVDSKINEAESIWLDITLRNKNYTYTLK